MRTLFLMVLLLFASLAFAQTTPTPVDCTFNYTATNAAPGTAFLNSTGPCASWRVTYYTSGFSAISIQIETSPDNSSWTAVTNTICAAAVQPPCVIDGANPSTTTGNQTFAVRAYGKYVRLNMTSKTGSGSMVATAYGYKGLSAQAGGGGGGGSGGTSAIACFSQTINTSSFPAAASVDVTLSGAVPVSANLGPIRILEGTQFSGGAGVLTVSIGVGGNATAFSPQVVLGSASPTPYRDAGSLSGSPENATPVAHFATTSGNLSSWTLGNVAVNYCVVTFP